LLAKTKRRHDYISYTFREVSKVSDVTRVEIDDELTFKGAVHTYIYKGMRINTSRDTCDDLS